MRKTLKVNRNDPILSGIELPETAGLLSSNTNVSQQIVVFDCRYKSSNKEIKMSVVPYGLTHSDIQIDHCLGNHKHIFNIQMLLKQYSTISKVGQS